MEPPGGGGGGGAKPEQEKRAIRASLWLSRFGGLGLRVEEAVKASTKLPRTGVEGEPRTSASADACLHGN